MQEKVSPGYTHDREIEKRRKVKERGKKKGKKEEKGTSWRIGAKIA